MPPKGSCLSTSIARLKAFLETGLEIISCLGTVEEHEARFDSFISSELATIRRLFLPFPFSWESFRHAKRH